MSVVSLLSVAHIIGLALGVGAATAKVAMLLSCKADPGFVPVYLKIARPLTRQIIFGLAILAVSGIGWLALGYGFTARLVVKLVMVAAIFALGPVIDNVIEPKFRALAPAAGEPPSAAFVQAENRYVTVEVIATLLFYVIIVMWVLR